MAPVSQSNFGFAFQDSELLGPSSLQMQTSPFDIIPTIDTTFTGSNYGSPPNDGRLPLSPVQKGLSALDAPLPASFDSQGISHMARYGPIAASVPSKFGFESPPSSLPTKAVVGSSALRNLHDSAFGDDVLRRLNGLGSSPPIATEETMGRRMMHSERFSKPTAASAQSFADEWEEGFSFEEDLVPRSLHELLTPQEKMRRLPHYDDENLAIQRQSLSGFGTPADSSSKVGSPITSSPSRFVGALFPRVNSKTDASSDTSLTPGASPFGHVGSPLRSSSLHPASSPSLRAMSKAPPGDASAFLSSPPRQGSVGTSIITQQLRGMCLSPRGAEAGESPMGSTLHPGMAARMASSSSVGSASSSGGRAAPDRATSSGSINREKIEEEQGLFSMEEEEQRPEETGGGTKEKDKQKEKEKERKIGVNGKRYSWGFGLSGGGKGSPSLGQLGGKRGLEGGGVGGG